MLENYDKEYLKRVFLSILGTILGILVIIYIGYQIWHKVTSSIKYEPATPYTYTVKSTGEGYVFRQEEVIPSPGGGSVVPSVEAGTKVATGSEVACLYSSSSVDAASKLADIDRQIEILKATSAGGQLTNRDVSKIDGETYEMISEIRRCVEQEKYIEATSHKMNLITKINRRNAASGMTGNVASQIESLEQKRAQITSELGTLLSTVTTPRSGWYYPETDGYESVFTVDKIANMTFDDFRNIISAPAASVSGDAGKTVTDPVWYFVCELSKESLDEKIVGEEYSIYFPHNRGKKYR